MLVFRMPMSYEPMQCSTVLTGWMVSALGNLDLSRRQMHVKLAGIFRLPLQCGQAVLSNMVIGPEPDSPPSRG